IRLHCATLFGKSYDSENLPPPATILEKSSWHQTKDFGTEEDSDGAMDEDSDILMNETYDSVPNFEHDPSFTYGDGPGHRQASPQTLAIIWQTMQKAGVSKFRPDLCQGFTSPDNLFLWNLAFKSFIILVRCGEYRDISLDMFDEKEIWEALKNHVKNCLKRRFREGMMDVDAQAAKAKVQQSQSQVTKAWVKYLLSQPTLIGLIPVVEGCCSDDETDDEAMEVDIAESQTVKQCRVLHLPWRSTQVENIMKLIDELRDPKNSDFPTKSCSPPSRERYRPNGPKESKILCKAGLPINCYSTEWLTTLPKNEVINLNTQVLPGFNWFLQTLQCLVK
ncbi:hypothetical protein BY996DRAFT_4587190, partial [Phakopsora pachyrhizi]